MGQKFPAIKPALYVRLCDLGLAIRSRRKSLGVSATATAEAAGLSRATLYRIEKGQASVKIVSYEAVVAALGIGGTIRVVPEDATVTSVCTPCNPALVYLADYPQLRQLAWHVHGTTYVTLREAWSLYERNWRHVDESGLSANERALIERLKLAFDLQAD